MLFLRGYLTVLDQETDEHIHEITGKINYTTIEKKKEFSRLISRNSEYQCSQLPRQRNTLENKIQNQATLMCSFQDSYPIIKTYTTAGSK